MSERPLLFIDVDGPLNPFCATAARRSTGYTSHRMRPAGWTADSGRGPLTVHLDPAHGPLLMALPYEPVWATTWEHDANRWIAPRLGLPALPVVEWERTHFTDPAGLHWKTRALSAYAAGRPFAWIDDELTDTDRTWLADHAPAGCLLLRVAPEIGLRTPDFAALDEWARDRAAAV